MAYYIQLCDIDAKVNCKFGPSGLALLSLTDMAV